MKKLLVLAVILFCAGTAFAQNPTAVTGTITDPNGIAYYPATVTATLTPSATNPTVGGQPINPNPGTPYVAGPVNTSSNGSFSIPLFANGDITPASTQYVITVSASGSSQPAGLGPQTFSVTVTISGSSQSLTTTLNAAAPALLPMSSAPATSVPFSGVTTGTNAVALHMGTGGSLNATGSGTIAATSAPFSGVSTGTNAVALHVGTGGTLDATGSGTIHATTSDTATTATTATSATTATTATTTTGNAGTATALASTPTLCSGGTPVAAGILANGNATGCQAGGSTPVSSTYLDLEFPTATVTTPVDGNYAWVNQGSTVETVNAGNSINLTLSNGSAGWSMRAKSQPATPYVIDVAFSATVPLNFNAAGIGFRESATNKITIFQVTSRNISADYWSNSTTFSSNLLGSAGTGGGYSSQIYFFRIANDGTNLSYWISPDGRNYIQMLQEAKTAHFTTAPDQVFFGMNDQAATPVSMTLISWYEH